MNYANGRLFRLCRGCVFQEDPTGGWENEKITTALWDELIADLNGLCRIAAEVGFSFAHFDSGRLNEFCVICRNCCVRTHFHNASSLMDARKDCPSAMKTAWRHTTNSATMTGCCLRRSAIAALF